MGDDDLVLSIDVGRQNLGMCILRVGEDPHGRKDTILHWVVTSTLPACHALVQTMHDAGIVEYLPRIKNVVIERQPGKNTPMVRLQCYLEMYFAMHDKFSVLQDARHKLSFAAATPFFPGSVPSNWSYYTRKKVSVQTTKQFLQCCPQLPHLTTMFERSPKKDDLADSLLQGMAFAHYVAPLENVKAQAKRAKVPPPRKPNAKQLAAGKLAKSHVVYLVKNHPAARNSLEEFYKACDEFKPLKKAVMKHFGTADFAFKILKQWLESPNNFEASTPFTEEKTGQSATNDSL